MFLFNQIGSPLVLLFLLVIPCMDEKVRSILVIKYGLR